MAYDAQHNILFLHIPKSGGKSVEAAMGIVTEEEAMNFQGRRKINRLATLLQRRTADPRARARLYGTLDVSLSGQHLTYQEIDLLGLIQAEQLRSAFKFATVRNPYDKAVSTFRHFRYRSGGDMGAKGFEEFWQTWPFEPTTSHAVLSFRRNQIDFIRNQQGEVAVDEILRFEHLAEDFEKIRRCFPHITKLPEVGVTDHGRKYESYYVPASRKIIDEFFARDLEFFEYTFN